MLWRKRRGRSAVAEMDLVVAGVRLVRWAAHELYVGESRWETATASTGNITNPPWKRKIRSESGHVMFLHLLRFYFITSINPLSELRRSWLAGYKGVELGVSSGSNEKSHVRGYNFDFPWDRTSFPFKYYYIYMSYICTYISIYNCR